jgi:hypothetical protein
MFPPPEAIESPSHDVEIESPYISLPSQVKVENAFALAK